MQNTLNFLIETGRLKRMKRKGWVLRKIKDPETIAAHTFRMVLMAWVLSADTNLNTEKVLKMSLIHDLCEVYAGDTTPYDTVLPKRAKARKELFKKWLRLPKKEKERIYKDKYKKEKASLDKLIAKLSVNLKKEIEDLWNDYEQSFSPEGKFVRQLDRMENLLQALEYWQKEKNFEIKPWWVQVEELIDEPILLEFMQALTEKFHKE